MATTITDEIELGPLAAAAARRSLRRLEPEVAPAVLDDLLLLVSELVTNSYRHSDRAGGATAKLRVDIGNGVVRVDVEDRGAGFVPTLPRAPLDRSEGWGLTIVDRIAERWGVTRDAGTHVWFEMPTGRGRGQRTA